VLNGNKLQHYDFCRHNVWNVLAGRGHNISLTLATFRAAPSAARETEAGNIETIDSVSADGMSSS
jgi:hypothetical protein